MAMSVGSGLPHDEEDHGAEPMSDINVTPMVDVMLVLLIIFMVAAPLMTTGVPVQLPKTAAAKVAQMQKPLEVSVDKTGNAFIAKDAFSKEALLARLKELKAENPEQVVLVRGDREGNYGSVMEVMGLIAQSGFTKVSLIAQSPGGGGSAPAPAASAPAAAAPASGAAQ